MFTSSNSLSSAHKRMSYQSDDAKEINVQNASTDKIGGSKTPLKKPIITYFKIIPEIIQIKAKLPGINHLFILDNYQVMLHKTHIPTWSCLSILISKKLADTSFESPLIIIH